MEGTAARECPCNAMLLGLLFPSADGGECVINIFRPKSCSLVHTGCVVIRTTVICQVTLHVHSIYFFTMPEEQFDSRTAGATQHARTRFKSCGTVPVQPSLHLVHAEVQQPLLPQSVCNEERKGSTKDTDNNKCKTTTTTTPSNST